MVGVSESTASLAAFAIAALVLVGNSWGLLTIATIAYETLTFFEFQAPKILNNKKYWYKVSWGWRSLGMKKKRRFRELEPFWIVTVIREFERRKRNRPHREQSPGKALVRHNNFCFGKGFLFPRISVLVFWD